MAAKPNPELTLAALVADLGRGRRDELPLSDRNHKNRPTFDPRRGGRPITINKDLKSAWGNPIKDSESEQQEGIALGDCPWRPNAQENANKARKGQTIIGLLPPSFKNKVSNELKSNLKPLEKVNHDTKPQAPEGPKAQNHNTPSLDDCDFFTNDPGSRLSPIWVFYHGRCMVYPTPDLSKRFIAIFEMEMRVSEKGMAQGFLHLTKEGLPKRSHEMRELWEPAMHRKHCLISTLDDQHSYRLEFRNRETTELFAAALKGLQMSLIANQKQHKAAAEAKVYDEAGLIAEPGKAEDIRQGQDEVLIDFDDDDSTVNGASTDVSTGNSGDKYANPEIMEGMVKAAITAICKMTSMMSSMPHVKETSAVLSDMKNLETRLLDSWDKADTLKLAPTLESAVKNVVETLQRLMSVAQKGIEDSFHMYHQEIPFSMREMMLGGIKYTSIGLTSLWDSKLSCPEAVTAATFVPRPKDPRTIQRVVEEEKKGVPRVDLLAVEKKGSGAGPKANGLASSMFANANETNGIPRVPVGRGLASSMYA